MVMIVSNLAIIVVVVISIHLVAVTAAVKVTIVANYKEFIVIRETTINRD